MLHQLQNSLGNFTYNAFVYNNRAWDAHFHANYELIYACVGTADITVNNDRYLLRAGEFLLIPPYAVHAIYISKTARVWIGVFSADFIYDFAKTNSSVRYQPFSCSASVESFAREHLLFEGTPQRYMAIACLNAVCGECSARAQKCDDARNNKFIGQVTDYISTHLTEEITLKAIAGALGYEYHYFSALFHKSFAIHFKSFINLFRFSHACELLSDTTKSITAVCFECGFDTVRNFNRVFKEHSGNTSSEYRKSL